jgi:1,4-alpha-glucan branching enzyme
MPVGRFMLVLHSHMPYVLSHGKSPHGTDWLFEAAVECYLPLLDALDRMRQAGVKPRWTVNMTPILAEQLDDPAFQDGFIEYCEEKAEFARQDRELFEAQGELWMTGLAAMWERWFTKAVIQFKHQCGRSITGSFKSFQDDGLIELITCGATHGYFPLAGTDESVQAQVKLAVSSHKKRFGSDPRGIWLPECAYRPGYAWKAPAGDDEAVWDRKGVEQFLAENGIDYFFVDSHMIRGGEPLGTYWQKFPQLAELFSRSKELFSPPDEYRSEYEHYLIPEGVTVFARDPQSTVKVWSGDVGYPGNPYYLEFHKQQYPGRLRYWRISEDKANLGAKQPYDPWRAHELVAEHAADFVNIVKGTLAQYKGQANREGTLVAMYDTELFGHWWWEGPEFLYELGMKMAADPDLQMCSGGDVIDQDPARHMIHLPEGSWGEGGYHNVWLNEDNHWTWAMLYPAQKWMRYLARLGVTGLAQEIAEQAARELLLAEASDWQFLISTFSAKDYAEARFPDHIDRFNRLAEMAERVHGGATLNEEELEFLRDCQVKDAPFPELDLSYWAHLDHPLRPPEAYRP